MRKRDAAEQTVGEPTWDVALLFPNQGQWSEQEYLALDTNRLVELCDGCLEVLPMPTDEHQCIVDFIHHTIRSFVTAGGLGKVLFAPLRVRVSEGRYREPDVVFLLAEHFERRHNEYWDGADLVVEVVSEDDPERDLVTKRREYAEAGIAEYWIADPRDRTITVLSLDESSGTYREAGKYGPGQKAASVLLDGLQVDVERAFAG